MRLKAVPLRIATYNVNGVNGRLPRLLEWLAETQPDIACLQELKTDDSKFPAAALRQIGYDAIWHGQRAHHGVAILAKGHQPIESRRGIPGNAEDVQTRYLEARVNGVTIASVYLPNGNPVASPNYEYKLAWFARFVRYAKTLVSSKAPVILAGDLNVIPADFDIYFATGWRFDAVMQEAVRNAFRELLAQGWTDAARSLYPKERMYTFWVDGSAFRANKGMRLDFFLLNPAASSLLIDAGVDTEYRGREKPSDHTPLWISIRRPEAN